MNGFLRQLLDYSPKDSILDHLQIAVHVKHVWFGPRGPDANREVWAGRSGAVELRGKVEIDASGLVVAPGFIDLHQHGQNAENYGYKAMGGVATALELEVGA